MTIRVIEKIENHFKTEKRPSWYPTYLVMCSSCWRQFPMIKYDIWKTEHCYDCANKLRWINGWTKHTKRIRHKSSYKKTHFYKKRTNIKWRCYYPSIHWFKNYWGRGIKVEWKNFDEFKRDMYESYLDHVAKYWEDNTTIDRIDVNWNYSKENCRWLTKLEQQSWKRNNHSVVYQWVEYPCLKALCRKVWQNYHRVHRRIKAWWDTDRAINTLV